MTKEIKRIREFLHNKAQARRMDRERLRLKVLSSVKEKFRDILPDSGIEVYLIGSIIRPYHFSEYSDIDIVLKNFKGDIYEIQKEIESQTDRDVDLIIYERSTFKELIDQYGEKILSIENSE